MSYYHDFRKKLTDLEQRDETNYILDFIVFAMKKFRKFGEKDIRHDYFDLMHDLIVSYSFNIKNFFLRVFIEFEKDKTEEELLKFTEKNFQDQLSSTLFQFRVLKTNLDRNLIIESWSMFEYAVTTIFEDIFSKEEQSTRKKKQTKIFKTVLKKNFDEEESKLQIVAEELVSKLDFFVPTMNKVNKIFKKYGENYTKKDDDFKFLKFFGQLRNGIHNNFIYKGPDKEDFEFKGTIYKFQDGKPIIEEIQNLFDIVDLVKEFYVVVLRYFESLKIDKIIFNPVPTMEEFFEEISKNGSEQGT